MIKWIPVFLIVFLVQAAAQMPSDKRKRRSVLYGSTIDAVAHYVRITNETFEHAQPWHPEGDTPPPLSPHRAANIGLVELKRIVPDASSYTLSEVSLRRFFKTDFWYYVIRFEFPDVETLLENKQRSPGEGVLISIVVLLDGSVIDTYQLARKITPPPMKDRMSYKERLQRRREELRKRQVESPKPISLEELDEHLKKYNMRLIDKDKKSKDDKSSVEKSEPSDGQ